MQQIEDTSCKLWIKHILKTNKPRSIKENSIILVSADALCFLQADHLFTEHMAGGNKQRTMMLMAEHVNAANAIYKNTDFNGDGRFEGRLDMLLQEYACRATFVVRPK